MPEGKRREAHLDVRLLVEVRERWRVGSQHNVLEKRVSLVAYHD